MLLEDILLVAAIGVVLAIVGWPIYRFATASPGRRRDPLAEAHERLRIAKIEAEAARVNREAEEIYDRMYREALDDGAGTTNPRATPGEPDREGSQTADHDVEKARRDRQR